MSSDTVTIIAVTILLLGAGALMLFAKKTAAAKNIELNNLNIDSVPLLRRILSSFVFRALFLLMILLDFYFGIHKRFNISDSTAVIFAVVFGLILIGLVIYRKKSLNKFNKY